MTNPYADRLSYLSALRAEASKIDVEVSWALMRLSPGWRLTNWYWRRRLVRLQARSDYLAREIDRTVYG